MLFKSYPFRDKRLARQLVTEVVGLDVERPNCTLDELAMLYELAADPYYENLPITPAGVLEVGSYRGGAASVLAVGCRSVNAGYVLTCDSYDGSEGYEVRDFCLAHELYYQLGLLNSWVTPIICDGVDLESFVHSDLRLCFINVTDDFDRLVLVTEFCLEQLEPGGSLCILHRGDTQFYGFVERLATNFGFLFTDWYFVGELVCFRYGGGYDWQVHDIG